MELKVGVKVIAMRESSLETSETIESATSWGTTCVVQAIYVTIDTIRWLTNIAFCFTRGGLIITDTSAYSAAGGVIMMYLGCQTFFLIDGARAN